MTTFLSIYHNVASTYASFFDLGMWISVLTSPEAWTQILVLMGLEGLLSADNALVLGVLVAALPVAQRKKALFYGLLGAVVFRFIFIGLGNYLTSILWIKYLGAGYLAWLAIKYFLDKNKDNQLEAEELGVVGDALEAAGAYEASRATKGFMVKTFGIFWTTVISVELTDLSFSVDSILAALAVSNQVWVLLMGGVLGIIMMRAAASVFTKLIERVPQMETTAYVLIAIIAVKMGISEYVHINHWIFFGLILTVFFGTFIVAKFQKTLHQLSA